MKKNLLLLGMLVIAASPVLAGVDVHTTTEPYYLRNGNYSDEAIRLIQLDKHYANGIQVPQKKHVYSENAFLNKSGEVINAVFNYLDPALDDGKFFLRDMPQEPGFDDL